MFYLLCASSFEELISSEQTLMLIFAYIFLFIICAIFIAFFVSSFLEWKKRYSLPTVQDTITKDEKTFKVQEYQCTFKYNEINLRDCLNNCPSDAFIFINLPNRLVGSDVAGCFLRLDEDECNLYVHILSSHYPFVNIQTYPKNNLEVNNNKKKED